MGKIVIYRHEITAVDTLEDLSKGPGNTVGFECAGDVLVCNRNASPVKVKLAVRDGAVENEDYIWYETTVPPNEPAALLTKEGFDAAEIVSVESNTLNVNFRFSAVKV